MKTAKVFAVVLMPAMLAGCLVTTPTECSDWNVECTDAAMHLAVKPRFGVARLVLVEVRAPYSEREIAVLRADGSIAFDPYNAYAAAPVQLLKGAAMESLERSGLFSAVVGASSSVDADVEVEVAVSRLALDCREDGSRRAVASLSVRLVRSHGIVAYATGSGSADASGRDFSAALSSAVTAAFSEALNRL